MTFKQGDIVLVPFPFSDLSATKTRPAVVISNASLRGDDVVVCALTSQSGKQYEIQLGEKDLSSGTLPFVSYIRVSKIVTLEKSLIRSKVASVSPEILEKIYAMLQEIIRNI